MDPLPVVSAPLYRPSANSRRVLLDNPSILDFDFGRVPGVFLGSFLDSSISREFRFQGFENEANMRRSMTGAVLMGFGGMLAGGCAIGNGVTGTSVFSLTAWIALFCFWVGAKMADAVLDNRTFRLAMA